MGRCATRSDFAASEVELHCKLAGTTPCAFFVLQGADGHTYFQ
jgi:hypothetical protein